MLKLERLHVMPGVVVKPVALTDAPAMATLIRANLAHLAATLPPVTRLADPEAARAHLDYAMAAASEGSLYEWHIFADGVLCGSVRVKQVDRANRSAAIGYYIGSSHQGRGLATLSVRAVLDWCFNELDMNRMELRCTSDNLPSQSVAKRLGFTWEGMLRQAELLNGVFVDHFVYGLLKSDFESTEDMEKAA